MRRGNSMVGLLAAAAVIMVLMVVVLGSRGGMLGVGGSTRKDGGGRTTLGAARLAAKDDVCRQQLNQVRQGIAVAQTSEDKNPESIDDIPGIKSISRCPIGKEPYVYDAATASIHCVHPGHEKF